MAELELGEYAADQFYRSYGCDKWTEMQAKCDQWIAEFCGDV